MSLTMSCLGFWKQMTDARCSRCSEIKVGLRDIIQAGHGDRYEVLVVFQSLLLLICISMGTNNHILLFV